MCVVLAAPARHGCSQTFMNACPTANAALLYTVPLVPIQMCPPTPVELRSAEDSALTNQCAGICDNVPLSTCGPHRASFPKRQRWGTCDAGHGIALDRAWIFSNKACDSRQPERRHSAT